MAQVDENSRDATKEDADPMSDGISFYGDLRDGTTRTHS